MKGRKCRADGGYIEEGKSPSEVYAGKDSNVVKEAEEKKRGGRVKRKAGGMVDGEKSHHRMDRPGRKSGGRVGADRSPLTGASRMTPARGRSFDAEKGGEEA